MTIMTTIYGYKTIAFLYYHCSLTRPKVEGIILYINISLHLRYYSKKYLRGPRI